MITVRLVGPMRKPRGQSELTMPHAQGMTVRTVLTSAGYSAQEVQYFSVQVDGVLARPETQVPAGATLTVFLPLGGG
jgi:hypothetical protein